MSDAQEDAQFVARCLLGDTQAFEPLVQRYQRVFFNVAWRLVGDREDARDVVQGAFVKAWEKLSSFDPRFRFFSWMYKIVLNESLNLRSRRPLIDHAALVTDLVAPGGPERELFFRDRADRLQVALQGLSESDRQVIVLRHFGEQSYAEIAEILGTTEKTVKSRLHEARRRLGLALRPGDFQ